MIDETDKKILNLLQENAKISNADIARKLKMAPSSVFERIKQLESKGIIVGYTTLLNCDKLCCNLIAFLFVKTSEHPGDTTLAKMIAKIPAVREVHHVAGDDCYLVKIKARDNKALSSLIKMHFGTFDKITSTRTTIVLETIKETSRINIV